jgi:hypothetical protein
VAGSKREVEWKGDKVSAEENKAEENKAISRRADEELFDRGNFKVADELFASNFVSTIPSAARTGTAPRASSSTPP